MFYFSDNLVYTQQFNIMCLSSADDVILENLVKLIYLDEAGGPRYDLFILIQTVFIFHKHGQELLTAISYGEKPSSVKKVPDSMNLFTKLLNSQVLIANIVRFIIFNEWSNHKAQNVHLSCYCHVWEVEWQ